MVFEEILSGILPVDFLMLLISAFLLSCLLVEPDSILKKFTKDRIFHFVILLAILLSFVFGYNVWKFNNSPEIYCNAWEEGCIPFALYNTHDVTLALFLGSICFFGILIFLRGLNLEAILLKLGGLMKEKVKNELLFKLIQTGVALVGMVLLYLLLNIIFLYIGPGLIFAFTEEPKAIQPLIYIHLEDNENKVDFYFKNNYSDDKLITKIWFTCRNYEPGTVWDSTTCSDLPKIVPSKKIEKISCERVETYKHCDSIDRVIATTHYGRNYPTIFKDNNASK